MLLVDCSMGIKHGEEISMYSTGIALSGERIMDIKGQKLLYHLTDINNLPCILAEGLLSRSNLNSFVDIADADIIESRKKLKLEEFVPFHFFARNPFDGGVQVASQNNTFILITVRRTDAEKRNWSIIPRHPLAQEDIELLSYSSGMDSIDWQTMNMRDYHNEDCKSVCMAECLAPFSVPVDVFFMVFVASDEIRYEVFVELKKVGLQDEIKVRVNPHMFLSAIV